MIRQGVLVFDRGVRPESSCAGLSLLERGIRTMARVGVERLSVIVPADARLKLSKLTRRLDIHLEILTWGSESTLPFLTEEPFLVLLGDHVHHHSSLKRLVERGLTGDGLVIQVSDAPEQASPLYRASVGDDVVRFYEVDPLDSPGQAVTGAFLCSGAMSPVEVSTAHVQSDDAEFLDLVSFLSVRAAGRKVAEHTVTGTPLWRKVSDRQSSRHAKTMLFSQVTKTTSGPVSRHINARLSIPTSKLLIETGISPHLVTVLFVMSTGLAAAYLISRPDIYGWFAAAGVLWQLAAILDRCDGEIARVQLSESKFGAWFDTVTDNIAYFSAYVGFLFGVQRLYPGRDWMLHLALSAVLALLLILGIMYHYALKTGSGSLQRYLVGYSKHVPESDKGLLYRAFERVAFIAKRDFFSFVFLLCCLADSFFALYWYLVGGLHLLALGVLISQRKMLKGHRVCVQTAKPVGQHPDAALDPTAAAVFEDGR